MFPSDFSLEIRTQYVRVQCAFESVTRRRPTYIAAGGRGRSEGGVEETPAFCENPKCVFTETAASAWPGRRTRKRSDSAVPVKRFAGRRVAMVLVFDFELGVPMTDDRRPAALVFEPQDHVRPVLRPVVRVLSAGGRHGFQQLYRQTVVVAAAYVAR